MGLLKPLRGLLPQPRNCLGDSQRWHQAPDPAAMAGAAEESCCLLGPRSRSRPGPTRHQREPRLPLQVPPLVLALVLVLAQPRGQDPSAQARSAVHAVLGRTSVRESGWGCEGTFVHTPVGRRL